MSGNHGVGRKVFEQRLGLRYIVNLARRERERDWTAERIDGRVDFRLQPATRAAHVLLIIASDAGSVLMHSHDGRIDHLHRRIMTSGHRIHDPVRDAGPPPANEPIVASRTGSVGFRQIARRCA